MPDADIYRRANGDFYSKTNEEYHTKVVVVTGDDGKSIWSPIGLVKKLDPNEEVEKIV